jgi:hippurate hydrolase
MSAVTSVLDSLDRVRFWQEDLYRDLHQHPELSHHEQETSGIAARLTQSGYQVHKGIGGTGVVGVLSNGNGPTVLLPADVDALPVQETTDLAYASTVRATDDDGVDVPVSHACGHDMHVACLLGAAQLLADGADQWQGTVVALFQPAEETPDSQHPFRHPRSG